MSTVGYRRQGMDNIFLIDLPADAVQADQLMAELRADPSILWVSDPYDSQEVIPVPTEAALEQFAALDESI